MYLLICSFFQEKKYIDIYMHRLHHNTIWFEYSAINRSYILQIKAVGTRLFYVSYVFLVSPIHQTAPGCRELEASRLGGISLPICWGQEIEAGAKNTGWRDGTKRTDREKLMLTGINLRRSTWINMLRSCLIRNFRHSSAMFSLWLIWLWDETWAIATAASCSQTQERCRLRRWFGDWLRPGEDIADEVGGAAPISTLW